MSDMECPGKRNFLGLSDEYSSLETSRFNIVPVPYDATATYMAGSRMGPKAIVDASAYIDLYDPELEMEPALAGVATLDDVPILAADPVGMIGVVEKAVAGVLARRKIPVVLGGEHTVSLGPVQALAAQEQFFLVSLDAHADLRDSYQGTAFSHACFLRRASELVDCCAFGVRSTSREEIEYARTSGTRLFYAHSILRSSVDALDLDFIPDTVYLSIDVDVFDPSIMPATGTPEPGGLGWYYALDLLKRIVSGRRVLGFDVVELCPLAGNLAPDFTAAKLVYRMMGLITKYSSNREDDRSHHGKEKVPKEAAG
jgi:agmatinase